MPRIIDVLDKEQVISRMNTGTGTGIARLCVILVLAVSPGACGRPASAPSRPGTACSSNCGGGSYGKVNGVDAEGAEKEKRGREGSGE